jgi:hypothetical protein
MLVDDERLDLLTGITPDVGVHFPPLSVLPGRPSAAALFTPLPCVGYIRARLRADFALSSLFPPWDIYGPHFTIELTHHIIRQTSEKIDSKVVRIERARSAIQCRSPDAANHWRMLLKGLTFHSPGVKCVA